MKMRLLGAAMAACAALSAEGAAYAADVPQVAITGSYTVSQIFSEIIDDGVAEIRQAGFYLEEDELGPAKKDCQYAIMFIPFDGSPSDTIRNVQVSQVMTAKAASLKVVRINYTKNSVDKKCELTGIHFN